MPEHIVVQPEIMYLSFTHEFIHLFIDLQLWVWAYREHRMHVNINTNNGMESQNEYLKYEFLDNHQNTSLTGLCTTLVEQFFPTCFER